MWVTLLCDMSRICGSSLTNWKNSLDFYLSFPRITWDFSISYLLLVIPLLTLQQESSAHQKNQKASSFFLWITNVHQMENLRYEPKLLLPFQYPFISSTITTYTIYLPVPQTFYDSFFFQIHSSLPMMTSGKPLGL